MPKVEGYQTVIAERPLDIPYQRLDPGNGTLLLARGVNNASEILGNTAARLQEEDDAAVVKERINNYRAKSLETLEQYRGVMGRDAYDSREKVTKGLEDYAQELGGDLTGRQQQAYKAAVQDYLLRDRSTIGGHAFEQRTTWLNGQDEALVAMAQEDYTAKPDPVYEKQIRSAAANLGARNGWAPEKQQLYVDEKISEANVAIVNQYMDTSPAQAAAFYQANKDKILPSMRAPLEKQIVEEGRSVAEQAYVEALLVKYGDDEKAGLADIRDNFSGPEEDRRVARWKARVGEITESKRVTQNEAVNNALTNVWEGKPITKDDEKFLKSIDKWDFIVDQQTAKATGVAQYNNPTWLANYYSMTLDEQMKVPPEELKANTDFNKYSELESARQKLSAPKVTQTNAALMKYLIDPTGETLSDKDKTKQDRMAALQSTYDSDRARWVEAHGGRQPTPAEDQEIIRGAAANVDLMVKKGFWGDDIGEGPKFLATSEQNVLELAEEMGVPKEAISESIEALRKKRQPLSMENLQKALTTWSPNAN